MIEIKLASTGDIKTIQEIANKTWFQTYAPINSREQNEHMFKKWYSTSGLKKQMNEGQEFHILSMNKSAIAFASLSKQSDSIAKLQKLYLLPQFQGLGIGKSLIEYIEKESMKKGVVELVLNVNRQNKAVHFYIKCGFQIVREENIPFDNYWMNDFVMSKTLRFISAKNQTNCIFI